MDDETREKVWLEEFNEAQLIQEENKVYLHDKFNAFSNLEIIKKKDDVFKVETALELERVINLMKQKSKSECQRLGRE